MKICQNPWCKKEFVPITKNQKYCSKDCSIFIRNKKKYSQISFNIVMKFCEMCGNKHDGSYGSGRFCSKRCKQQYIFSKNRNAHNPKIKAHLDKLRAEGKINYRRASYGTWKCKICGHICETRALLKQHNINKHQCQILIKKNTCPYCGKEFENGQKLGGHLSSCIKHPLKESHKVSHKKGGQTYKERLALGYVIHPWKNRHHSIETRQKLSIKRIASLDSNVKCGKRLDVKWYKVKNLNGIEYTVRGHWEEMLHQN